MVGQWNRYIEIIKEQLNIKYGQKLIKGEHKLVNDFGFDSLDMVEVIIKIEKEFNCSISDFDIHENITVQELFDLIK